MKRRGRLLIAVAVIGIGALAGAIAGEPTHAEFSRADAFMRRYTEILSVLVEKAPLKTAPDELVYSSLEGMMQLLDPHTNFLRPDAYSNMRERQQGSFHGIGVIISMRGGRITVISPIEGTPAARLGLRAGDVIEAVDGQPTEGLDIDDVARKLRGAEGTSVKVTISRPGLHDPLELEIQRARVPTDSVRNAFILAGDVGYISISDFTRTTGDETGRALGRLVKQGATKLLIDLRNNPGGTVDSAVEVAGMLLAPGQQVFSTKGRTADSFQDYRAARDGLHFSGPVVVLVNRGSASAAEIVAGAVQDHDRGLVVGEVTFGKGVVQTVYPVRDTGLALTTAKYYTPSGRCIQRDFDSFFSYVHRGDDDEGEAGPAGELAAPKPTAAPTPTPPPTAAGTVYFTDSGRKVYGGGGIVPDYHKRLDQYSERLARLLGQSAFFHFAVDFLADKPDKTAAARAFTVTPEVIARFRTRVVAEKWLPEAEIDRALGNAGDRHDIEVALRAEVLNAGVSLSEGFRAFTDSDTQLQAALKLFDEAAKLQARARVTGGTTTQALRSSLPQ
jgi:carboxyl-terminal processing protease